MNQLTDLTNEMVGVKLKVAYNRFKGIWNDNNKKISKLEDKFEKVNEQIYELREYREELESELEGIRSTYEQYCLETNQVYDMS